MNKQKKSIIINILTLAGISTFLYGLHYIFFDQPFITLGAVLSSLAFAPIQIIFDTLVIDRIMEKRENIKKAKKINMIIGSFYNVVGNDILELMVRSDPDNPSIKSMTRVSKKCCDEDFLKLKSDLMEYNFKVDITEINLEKLKVILDNNNKFFIDLMISSVVDEDEEFSRMIMAVVHLRDELETRVYDRELQEYERRHIKRDIENAYRLLTYQWVDYMKHLKVFYTQLFIKALILSPFDDRSSYEKDDEFLD